MLRRIISYFLFGIGILGFLFALARTYYLVWKLKKDREAPGRRPPAGHVDEDKKNY